MGLFDFFKKKEEKKHEQEQKMGQQQETVATDVSEESSEEASTVGWDAIEQEFLRVYPWQTDPKHYGTLLRWRIGGNDPLDGISVYDAGDHWHFVTFGQSELYEKESDDPEYSGFGYELTFKLKKGFHDNENDEEEEIQSICGLLQFVARITFTEGAIFRPNEFLYTGQTEGIDLYQKSKLTGFIVVQDPTVETLQTPNGIVEFHELIGMTDAELRSLSSRDSVKAIYEKLGSDITDFSRDSIV